MLRELKVSLLALVALTLATGVVYPLIVTGVAQLAFRDEAQGSLVHAPDGTVVGSALIGQGFRRPDYFWSRASHAGAGWDATASSGSNYGPRHPDLARLVAERLAALRAADPGNAAPVPVELVTASASGLDPHLSPAGAYYQVGRVAERRGLAACPDKVKKLVDASTRGPLLGLFGEPVVSVLALNRALDALGPASCP